MPVPAVIRINDFRLYQLNLRLYWLNWGREGMACIRGAMTATTAALPPSLCSSGRQLVAKDRGRPLNIRTNNLRALAN